MTKSNKGTASTTAENTKTQELSYETLPVYPPKKQGNGAVSESNLEVMYEIRDGNGSTNDSAIVSALTLCMCASLYVYRSPLDDRYPDRRPQ